MDIEDRLQKIESDVRRTKLHAEAVLVVILLLLVLILLGVGARGDWIVGILLILGLAAAAHLLVSAGSGLRVFWGRRDTDAQLEERIMREFIAERAKSPNRNHP
jgi:hypothetical protein